MTTHDMPSCRPLMLLAAAIAVVMFVFPMFVPFPLLDPDEGLHAAIAQEMVEHGNWIVPHFLGEPFLDKPIFYFWIQAVAIKLLGSSETAIRLPGLLFGLLGAATTGLLARRLLGRPAGWIAFILYATTVLPTALAQAASHDVALIPWINLALLMLWELERSEAGLLPRTGSFFSPSRAEKGDCSLAAKRDSPIFVSEAAKIGTVPVRGRWGPWRYVLGAGVFLGLSILTKGLVGVAVVGLVYGGYALIRIFRDPKIALRGMAVLLVAAAVAAPWYLAVETQHPGFLRHYLVDRHLLGFATDTQPHSNQPWWYYLPILLGGGLPWIGYVAWGRGTGDEGREKREQEKGRGGERETDVVKTEKVESASLPLSPSPPLPSSASCLPSPFFHFPLPRSPLPLLYLWLLGWTALLTVAQSKLVTYLWPAFPPLAILAAATWSRLIDGTLDGPARRRFARTFVSSTVLGPIALPAVVAAVQWACGIRFGWPAWTAVGLVAALTPLPLVAWRIAAQGTVPFSLTRKSGQSPTAVLAAAALSVAAQFVVVMAVVMPPVADAYSARQLARYFNRRQRLPDRLWMVEERIGSLVFYLDPPLRAALKRGQLESLYADRPLDFRPGDVLAVAERQRPRAAEYLDLAAVPRESVGHYRLYCIQRPMSLRR